MMCGKLEGKVAWVSGANKGIGEGISRLFAKEGAKIAMIGRTVSEGNKIAEEIEEQGGEAFFFRCDVRSEDDIKASISETVKRYGTIDILINNAGVLVWKPLLEQSSSEIGC